MIVKVCGMRQPENIRAVEQAGADWIGLICYDRSPRFVSSVPSYLPKHSKRIGVFVNEDYAGITHRAHELSLDYLQLHSKETPELCKSCMKKVSDLSRLSPFEKHPIWSVPMHMLLTVIISFSTLPVMDMEVQDNLSTGVYWEITKVTLLSS